MVGWLTTVSQLFESSDKKSLRKTLRNLLGVNPKNLSLYQLSLTHRSAAIELPNGVKMSNERLEFLGDAILGAAVGALSRNSLTRMKDFDTSQVQDRKSEEPESTFNKIGASPNHGKECEPTAGLVYSW